MPPSRLSLSRRKLAREHAWQIWLEELRVQITAGLCPGERRMDARQTSSATG